MSPIRIHGTLRPEGFHEMRPRGSLVLPDPESRLVAHKFNAAYEDSGSVDMRSLRWATVMTAGAIPREFPEMDVVDECDELVVWGGAVGMHYGHFLLESVSRLWPLLTVEALPEGHIVFTREPEPPLPASVEWLEAFGAHTINLPMTGAVRFTRMVVPELAWRVNAWCCPEIRDIHLRARRGLDVVPRTANRDILWLSRSELVGGRRAYDECLLEWLLDQHVSVINPEQLTLSEQVGMLEASRAVVGIVGSAFHTLLLTERVPDCLYLCPQLPKPAFPAQHMLLDGEATFAVQTLEIVAHQRRPREMVVFPAGFRLLVPEVLLALSDTVLPNLLDDPRLAMFADPEGHRSKVDRWSKDLDATVLRVLLEPLSVDARKSLAAAFEAQSLDRCAREQLAMVANLTGDA